MCPKGKRCTTAKARPSTLRAYARQQERLGKGKQRSAYDQSTKMSVWAVVQCRSHLNEEKISTNGRCRYTYTSKERSLPERANRSRVAAKTRRMYIFEKLIAVYD